MSITVNFSGPGSTESVLKSMTFSVGEGKSALTSALEVFQKETNTYLTKCIENQSGNPVTQAGTQNVLNSEEEEDEEDDEEAAIEVPSKVMKLS